MTNTDDINVPEIEVPDGKVLDEECRQGQEDQLRECVTAARSALAAEMKTIRARYLQEKLACDQAQNQAACIAAAREKVAADSLEATANYESSVASCEQAYVDNVTENCISDA